MFKVRTYNRISPKGLKLLSRQQFLVDAETNRPDAILLRSHNLTGDEIDASVSAIARAGAGVSNIPVSDCSRRGVVVFNTPGANANAVNELVLAAMVLSARNVMESIGFVKSLPSNLDAEQLKDRVEQGKNQFVGSELRGKTLGLIGLGAIGAQVASTALRLGMEVVGYDPYLSVDAALRVSRSVRRVEELESLFGSSDFISVHVPGTADTTAIVNDQLLELGRDGFVLINAARPNVVDERAVANALEKGHLARYFVDFPSKLLMGHPRVHSTPHIGASTQEAEDNCAVMAASTLRDFFLEGTIQNSVNFPDVVLPRSESHRLTIANDHVSGILRQLLSLLADRNINVIDMVTKSRDDVAFSLIDVDTEPSEELLLQMQAINAVTRVGSIGLPS